MSSLVQSVACDVLLVADDGDVSQLACFDSCFVAFRRLDFRAVSPGALSLPKFDFVDFIHVAPVLIHVPELLSCFAILGMFAGQGAVSCSPFQVLQVLVVKVAVQFAGTTVDECSTSV